MTALTPAQRCADELLTALKAQLDKDGHTFDCNHLRDTFGGLDCCGQCYLVRQALASVERAVAGGERTENETL